MKRTLPKYFWPAFATGLFLANIAIIGVIVFIALTKASPIEGPQSTTPAAQEAQQ